MPELLIDHAKSPRALLLLSHGAGAPMDSPFMQHVVSMLVERNLSVARFEFPYMAQRRIDGKRRPAPKAETLIPDYAEVLSARPYPELPCFVGGKSMGGRVATMLAASPEHRDSVSGVICLGYPFHPPQKPDQVRTGHLQDIDCPVLIVQGERDPLGSQKEILEYQLSPQIRITWAPDGDHDLGPRGASGYTRKGNLTLAADAIADFVAERAA